MAAPVISVIATFATSTELQGTAATGVGPFDYQWHKSTTENFTPAGGNAIAGAENLTLVDTGLTPNVIYYYKLVSIDTGNSNLQQISNQATTTTAQQSVETNTIGQSPFIGELDLMMNWNTVAAQVDVSEASILVPGQAVKVVDNTNGIPTVIKCAANTDEVFGFINFNPKQGRFRKGDRMQVSLKGNIMYMSASTPIARMQQVTLQIANAGSVAAANGSGGETIVGWAYDKAVNPGDVIRVYIETPSFLLDA